MVCGLIGKFECTGSAEPADVKVTANSCRASDSVLITYRGCPITRGSSPSRSPPPPPWTRTEAVEAVGFREIAAGNRNECADKMATMGVGGVPGAAGATSRIVGPELEATVHRIRRERQRKTVVYSRLCLDDGMLGDDVGLREPSDTGPRVPGPTFGWATRSGQAEVIRFPCVERLIELYANIIRQKEAEVQRFMSSIVRDDDKTRLDKAMSEEGPEKRRETERAESRHGSKLQQGDIRKEAALPASVSLESLPRQNTDLVGDDRQHTTPALRPKVDFQVVTSRSGSGSDEGWRSSTHHSLYGSSDEEERTVASKEPEIETMKNRDKVTRSSSSDSALGLDEDLSQQEQQQMIANVGKVRRLTLGVSDIPLRSALLPVPEPSMLPSVMAAPMSDHCPTVVRSKMILEAQLIELPLAGYATDGTSVDPATAQQQLGCPPSTSVSRRESAQSYISDTGEGVRYVRTPSVVVSDYSDDTMCGITLEEIEYFRRHRLRRGSADCESDISAASSCSNLNYCGSSISALEGCEYQCGLRTPERKVSDCSTCSTVSCDEDEGYSVVRSKLAALRLPSGTPLTEEEEPTKSPEISPAESCGGRSSAVVATTEEGDVRVCSKKKVSHGNVSQRTKN